MKIKVLIAIVTGILTLIFLMIDLKSAPESLADKWSSFGLGMVSTIFLANILAMVINYFKRKKLSGQA